MRLAIALLLFAASSAVAGGLTDLDAKNGFRDAQFGAKFETFQGMELLEESGDLKFYRRSADELKIGAAVLESISYGFYKGELMSVVLKTDGLVNSQALLEALQSAYGPGFQKNKHIPDFWWLGKVVTMSYDQNMASRDASARISSVAVSDKFQADRKAAAKSAKSDL